MIKEEYEFKINQLEASADKLFDELMDTDDEAVYTAKLSEYNKVKAELDRIKSFYNKYVREA